MVGGSRNILNTRYNFCLIVANLQPPVFQKKARWLFIWCANAHKGIWEPVPVNPPRRLRRHPSQGGEFAPTGTREKFPSYGGGGPRSGGEGVIPLLRRGARKGGEGCQNSR